MQPARRASIWAILGLAGAVFVTTFLPGLTARVELPEPEREQAHDASLRLDTLIASADRQTVDQPLLESVDPFSSLPGSLRVFVQTADSVPVEGAEVLVYPRGSPYWSSGRTGADGAALIDRARLTTSRTVVVAVAEGYSPESRLVPPGATELEIVVHMAASISGTLTFHGSPLRLAGLRVVADGSVKPEFDKTRIIDFADPELALSSGVTDDGGRFTISAVRQDRSYVLYAGGKGYYSRERTAVGTTGDRTAVFVPVEKVFGAVTRFVDESGADIGLPRALAEGNWWRSVFSEGGRRRESTSLDTQVPYIGLSGLDPYLTANLPPSWGLILESTDRPFPDLGRRVDQGRPPGFDEYHVTYELLPLEVGLADVPILLRRTAQGWGDLRVRFVDAVTGTKLPLEFAPFPGQLSLVAGDPETLRAMDRLPSRAHADPARAGSLMFHLLPERGVLPIIHDVPHGKYTVWYRNRWGTYEHPLAGAPSVLVEIGPEPAFLSLPVERGLGAIALELRLESDGAPYEGLVHASLVERVAGPAGNLQARRGRGGGAVFPPYVFDGIPEGSWTMKILLPRISPESGSRIIDVDVLRNRVTKVSRLVDLRPNSPN